MRPIGDRWREERVSGERVYEGRILSLEVDRVRRDDGHEAVREVVRHPGAAVVLPLLEGSRLLFVRQHRYAVARDLLELPAGKLDPGETAATCAGRELVEETGFRAGELTELGAFFTTPGFSDERIVAFAASRLERVGAVAAATDELIEPVVLAAEEAWRLVSEGGLKDAKTLATLALALARGLLPTPGR